MCVKGNLTIDDDVNLTSTCGDIISGDSFGIYSKGALTISGNAFVKAEAGYAPNRSCGIYAYTTLDIYDNANITAIGGGKGSKQSCGIRTTDMTIKSGSLVSMGGDAYYDSYGIFTQTLDISGGEVSLTSGQTNSGPSAGVHAVKLLNIGNSTVNANGGNAPGDSSYGIIASDVMNITSGIVNAQSSNAEYTYGIEVHSLNISGGDLTSTAMVADEYSYGINVDSIVINSGNVNAISDNAGIYSDGICSSGNIDITGGKVVVSNGDAVNSIAVYAFGRVNITNAILEITSKGYGIYVPYGGVSINSTETKDSLEQPELTKTKVIIDAAESAVYSFEELSIDEKLIISSPVFGEVSHMEDENYYYISTSDKSVSSEVTIELGYSVQIKGLDNDIKIAVPVGQSVNETYCEIMGVDNFIKALDTTKDGYTFEGFYTDENYTENSEYSFDTPVICDVTIYAKYKKTIQIETISERKIVVTQIILQTSIKNMKVTHRIQEIM